MNLVKKGYDQEGRLRSTIKSFPREVLLEILSRLPIGSLQNVKLVCKRWHELAQDPLLVSLRLPCKTEDDPCLILHCDYPVPNQLYAVYFYTNNQNSGMVKKIDVPLLPEFDVIGSCDGWLCLCDSRTRNEFYIYNPFTSAHVQLPKPNQLADNWTVFGYGVHPATNEYKVVKISINNGRSYRGRTSRSDVEVLTIGSSSWRILGEALYYPIQAESQVLVNGRLHWVDWPRRYRRGRKLVSFDLSDEKFREIPKPDPAALEWYVYNLVVLGGCLSAAVYCNYSKYDIWVMKEYEVKESWMKKCRIDYGSYVPMGLQAKVDDSFKVSKFHSNSSYVRVLGQLKNGDVLLEYRCRALVCYNPESGMFFDVSIHGMPNWFESLFHVSSLKDINGLIGI